MRIRGFGHKPLKRFYDDGVAKGLLVDTVSKLRSMFVHIPLDADSDSGTKAIAIPGGCR